MAQDPELPIEDEKVDTTPNAPIETPTATPAGDDQEPQSDQPAKPRRGRARSTAASAESADDSADTSLSQGTSAGDTEKHPSPSGQADASQKDAEASPDQEASTGDTEKHPSPSGQAGASQKDAEASPIQGVSMGDTEEHPSSSGQAEAAKDEAPTALSSIAQQIIRDHGLDIVFMTSDGTAFFTFNDAANYGRNLVDPDVSYFTRPGLSADELKTIIPDHLQEKKAHE